MLRPGMLRLIQECMSTIKRVDLLGQVADSIGSFESTFETIPDNRKRILEDLVRVIKNRMDRSQDVRLNFICTHNSRRSHMAQIWAMAAAAYYEISGVTSYSGGTEATSFNPKAIKAMREVGFKISDTLGGENPSYDVRYTMQGPALQVYSKKYDAPGNPSGDFIAVMTCGQADKDCPIVVGASQRFAITYDDPKEYDGTTQEAEKYLERVNQIGREISYVFYQLNGKRHRI